MEIKYLTEVNEFGKFITVFSKFYPNRKSDYFQWWIRKSFKESTNETRTFTIEEDKEIIGLTTGRWEQIYIKGQMDDFYWECNTIINPKFQGKGYGRVLYEEMSKYSDRITTGLTEKAASIQPKIIQGLKKIIDVNVYLYFNQHILKTIKDRNKKIQNMVYPDTVTINKIIFKKVTDINEMNIPKDGLWINDDIELIRDKEYILNRFFNIYREYGMYYYNGMDGNCYFVVRIVKYKGFNMISIVDYRYTDKKLIKDIENAVNKIALLNKIGLIIELTSLKKTSSIIDKRIRTNKILKGCTTIPEIENNSPFLITSADADLDFVYYS